MRTISIQGTTLNRQKEYIDSTDILVVTVYPDIIIHHRGTNDNFIVIEAKKSNCPNEIKLKAYKKELKYQYAFFVTFPVMTDFKNIGDKFLNFWIQPVELSEDIYK